MYVWCMQLLQIFLGKKLENTRFFRNFVIKITKLLRLGKKKNEFFCFALDFS